MSTEAPQKIIDDYSTAATQEPVPEPDDLPIKIELVESKLEKKESESSDGETGDAGATDDDIDDETEEEYLQLRDGEDVCSSEDAARYLTKCPFSMLSRMGKSKKSTAGLFNRFSGLLYGLDHYSKDEQMPLRNAGIAEIVRVNATPEELSSKELAIVFGGLISQGIKFAVEKAASKPVKKLSKKEKVPKKEKKDDKKNAPRARPGLYRAVLELIVQDCETKIKHYEIVNSIGVEDMSTNIAKLSSTVQVLKVRITDLKKDKKGSRSPTTSGNKRKNATVAAPSPKKARTE